MKVKLCPVCAGKGLYQGETSGRWYCRTCTSATATLEKPYAVRLVEVTPLITPQDMVLFQRGKG